MPFKELNTAAGHSLMCQTSNQKAAPSTKSEKKTKKWLFVLSVFFWTNVAKLPLERQMNSLLIYTCYSTAQLEETVMSMEGEEGRFLEMQWSHTLASRRNLQTYFQVLLSNCLFALNTFGKVCYIAKVTVTTEQQMKRIKHWTTRKMHLTLIRM